MSKQQKNRSRDFEVPSTKLTKKTLVHQPLDWFTNHKNSNVQNNSSHFSVVPIVTLGKCKWVKNAFGKFWQITMFSHLALPWLLLQLMFFFKTLGIYGHPTPPNSTTRWPVYFCLSPWKKGKHTTCPFFTKPKKQKKEDFCHHSN